ncbi:MAG: xanthine phosphoribosyltransferase [Proteobacteria bacterium]|nr:xanthine phosphoribosyltransferase [Pseudomonadota bacterium]
MTHSTGKDSAIANDLVVSWDMLHRQTRRLARKLVDAGPFDGLLCVSRGGLAPAAILAAEMDIRMIDVIAITSYDGRGQGQPAVIKEPSLPRDDRLLVVDDIADTGRTLQQVRQRYPNAVIATVYAKPEGRPWVDHCGLLIAADVWVVFPWDAPGDVPEDKTGAAPSA